MTPSHKPIIRGRRGEYWFPPGIGADDRVPVPDTPFSVLADRNPLFEPRAGGFGQAWLGEHRHDGSHVVLKFFDPKKPREHENNPNWRHANWQMFLDLFGQEASRGAELAGDHVLKHLLYVPLKDPWRPVLVMEWADLSLDDLLAALRATGETRRLPPRLVRQIIRDACLGLHALHQQPHRLVHNDVKPGNLFLRFQDGGGRIAGGDVLTAALSRPFKVAVGDLGVAQRVGRPTFTGRFTQDGAKAPEQLRDGPHVELRSDLYGLGLVLRALLTYLDGPPSAALNWLADQCTRPACSDRPASAMQVYHRIEALAYHQELLQVGIDDPLRFLDEQGVEYLPRRAVEDAFRRLAAGADFRLLRLVGGPGTGKSTALADLARRHDSHGPAYFLSTLKHPSLREAVATLWQTLRTQYELAVPEPREFNADTLHALLVQLDQERADWFLPGQWLWLYLDGLDEADEHHDYRRYLPTRLPPRVKLVVSSRCEPRFDDLDAAAHALVVSFDDPQYRQSNLEEAALLADGVLANSLPEIDRTQVAEALGGNFLLVRVVCLDWKERGDAAAVRRELDDLRRDFAGGTAGEDALHRVYKTYFWERMERQVRQDPRVSSEEFGRVAGLLAVAELPAPVDLLPKYDRDLRSAREAVRILRPFLLRGAVRAANGATLDAFRYAHKTFQTFITSRHGPLPLPDDADALRRGILAWYEGRPAGGWDHYGRAAFVRLCVRLGDADSLRRAAAALRRPEFLEAVVTAAEPDAAGRPRPAGGLGVDGLREMVAAVRQAAGLRG